VFITGIGGKADENIRLWHEDRRRPPREQRYPSYLPSAVTTKEDGRFVLSSVPPGVRLRVIAIHADHAPVESAAFTLAPGGELRVPTLRFVD
jgi:hypothetical protein